MGRLETVQLMQGDKFAETHGFEPDKFYLLHGGTADDPDDAHYCVGWWCDEDQVFFRTDGEQMADLEDLKVGLIDLPEDPENAV